MSYKLLFIESDGESDGGQAGDLREALETAGHGMLRCSAAAEALRALEQYRPDLIVIGSDLADKTAVDLCREMKETTNGEKTPIVLVGDQEDVDAVAQLAQSGCDHVIEKPVTAERLIEVMAQLVGNDVTDETVPSEPAPEATSDSDNGRLDDDELDSAMGQFESILDESDSPPPKDASATARASARGDFSQILDEANVDQQPSGDADDEEEALEGELLRAFDSVTEQETATEAGDTDREGDEGRDIEDHLDTLFSGRGAFEEPVPAATPSPASAAPTTAAEPPAPAPAPTPVEVESAPAAPEPVHQAAASTASPETSLKTTQPMAVQTEVAPSDPEPLEPPAPAPAAAEPDAAPPPAHELFDPAEPRFPSPRRDRKSTGSAWWIAAGFAIVLLGGGALLMLLRGDEPAPARPEPEVADSAPFSPPAPDPEPSEVDLALPETAAEGPTTTEPATPESVLPTPTPKATDPVEPPPTRASTSSSPTPSPAPPKTTAKPKQPEAKTPETKPTVATTRPVTKSATEAKTKPVAAEPPPTPKATPEPTTERASTPKEPETTATDRTAAQPPTAAAPSAARPAEPPASTDESTATSRNTSAPTDESPSATRVEVPVAAPATDEPAPSSTDKATTTPVKPADRAAPETVTAGADSGVATEKTTVATEVEAPAGTTGTTEAPAATDVDPETAAPTPDETAGRPSEPEPSAEPPATVVKDVKEPIVLQRVEPQVPAKALNGRRGTVVLKVLVNEQGRIARVLVERGIPGSVLESAAINAVLRWQFQPATKNGEPIRAWTKATFEFGE